MCASHRRTARSSRSVAVDVTQGVCTVNAAGEHLRNLTLQVSHSLQPAHMCLNWPSDHAGRSASAMPSARATVASTSTTSRTRLPSALLFTGALDQPWRQCLLGAGRSPQSSSFASAAQVCGGGHHEEEQEGEHQAVHGEEPPARVRQRPHQQSHLRLPGAAHRSVSTCPTCPAAPSRSCSF